MSGAEQARGPVTPLPRERVLARGESELPLWEDQGAATLAMSWDTAQAAPTLAGASTLVISCTRWRPPWLPALLRDAVKAGVRPYLLCESWQGAEEDRLLQELEGRWLVRSGVEVPATFLVLDRGRTGWLYLGAPGAEPRHRLLLPQPQARALFEVFAYLFWHEARHEHLAHRWEPCRPAPAPRGAPPQSPLCSLHAGPVPRPLIPAPELSVEPQGGGVMVPSSSSPRRGSRRAPTSWRRAGRSCGGASRACRPCSSPGATARWRWGRGRTNSAWSCPSATRCSSIGPAAMRGAAAGTSTRSASWPRCAAPCGAAVTARPPP